MTLKAPPLSSVNSILELPGIVLVIFVQVLATKVGVLKLIT